ncbi:carbonic anhydrase [Gemmobacter aquarius]|uniref:Carbonic anhydrase n=1 Tax=Paragemmobacter aquarius TaxID=2169400 RepID=A0A2S0UNF4_9RHOB|nr:carbonic anhydrase family protein [Gemmobacter aquarius]AWB49348.1 carbonic anhydrase [Gemmobacter aquarius]
MCTDCNDTNAPRADRRQFLGLAAMLAGGAALSLTAGRALADECAPFLADAQAATTPDQAIQLLADGNARFAANASLHCDLLGEMKATAEKQTPFACVLACIDSRSAPELVFDQQIGDLFVARVAGNLPTTEVLGSFEYATKVAGTKAIVVLGHSHCGAVKGAVDKADVGANLTTLLDAIEPAIAATPLTGERSSKNHEFVEAVAETNVRMAVAAMTANSPVLADLVAAGALKIVGALYDIETGKVSFLA